MAKKFFYNRVYNTKRTIINIVIIGVCVIGIIICFIITSNFQGEDKRKPEGKLSIKSETTVEINEKISKDMFFSQIENVNLDNIEIKYPEEYDISKTGKYEVTIVVEGKEYKATLINVDTKKPELSLKEVTITEGNSYTANDFVSKCTDNSNEECNISFYTEGLDQEGNNIKYDNYTKEGTYAIKIMAKDVNDNQTVEETRLKIVKKDVPTPDVPPVEKPVTCKYGDGNYDTTNYLIAINITTNNCAVSLDLYKSSSMTEEINKLMDLETTRIKKDVEALNLKGTIALNRKVTAVTNTTGDGIVGYELRMTATITDNGNSTLITDYKVDSNGKRVFIANDFNLSA